VLGDKNAPSVDRDIREVFNRAFADCVTDPRNLSAFARDAGRSLSVALMDLVKSTNDVMNVRGWPHIFHNLPYRTFGASSKTERFTRSFSLRPILRFHEHIE